jgi:tetratricopeptide (TPR) repeat protein
MLPGEQMDKFLHYFSPVFPVLLLGGVSWLLFYVMKEPPAAYGVIIFLSFLTLLLGYLQIFYADVKYQIGMLLALGYFILCWGIFFMMTGCNGVHSKLPFWVWPVLFVFLYNVIFTLPFLNIRWAMRLNLFCLKNSLKCLFAFFGIALSLIVTVAVVSELAVTIALQNSVALWAMAIIGLIVGLAVAQRVAHQIIEVRGESGLYSEIPEDGVLSNGQRITYSLWAESLAQAGEYTEAIRCLDQLIKLKPDDKGNYLLRASARTDNGQPGLAIEDYRRILQQWPTETVAYYKRGLVYISLKKFDLALADLDQVIRLEPEAPSSYNLRSEIYLLRGEYSQVVRDATRAIQLGEKQKGLMNRSLAYEMMGDSHSAIADLSSLLKFSRNKPRYLARRGLLLMGIGESRKAQKDFHLAMKRKNLLGKELVEKVTSAQMLLNQSKRIRE